MNCVDCIIMEQFDLDPKNYIDPYQNDFRSCDEFVEEANQIYMELFSGTNKTNVIAKLVKFIINAFKLMGKILARILSAIGRLFTGGKNKRSIDDICDASGLSRSSGNSVDSSSSRGITPPAKDASFIQRRDAQFKRMAVELVASSKSTVDVPDHIELMYKDLKLSFNHAIKGIRLTPLKADIEANNHGRIDSDGVMQVDKNLAVKGQNAAGCMEYVFALIKDDSLLDKFIRLGKCIATIGKDNRFENEYDSFNTEFGRAIDTIPHVGLVYEITYKDINKLQIAISDIWKDLEPLGDADLVITDVSGDPRNTKLLAKINMFANVCANVQMGLNLVTNIMTGVYVVDASYANSVSDINQLAKFVENCISGGIPAKYIAYNVYVISKKNLSNKVGRKGDKDNPIFGQSRLVLFPSDKNVVYKIALSGWGKASNLTEVSLTERLDRLHESDIIARTTGSINNGFITVAERIDSSKDVNYGDISFIKSRASQLTSKYQLQFKFEDLHGHNIGYKNGDDPCIIDYGWINRIERV